MKIRIAPPLYLLLIGAAVAFWTELDGLIYPANVFPRFVLVLVGICAAIALIQDLKAGGSEEAVDRRFLFACAIALAAAFYIWMITLIGYYPASALFLIVCYPLVHVAKDGVRRSGRLLLQAPLATAFVIGAIYLVFTILLKINVPMLLDNGPL